jgi:hypothetical protein
VDSWGKIQAPKNSKSSVLKSELQDTLDKEKRENTSISTKNKLQMCEVEVVKM